MHSGENDEEIRRLRERNRFFQNKNADLEEIVDKYKIDLTKTEFERDSLKKQLEQLKTFNESEKEKVVDTRKQIRDLENENKSLKILIKEHSDKNNTLQEQINKFESKTKDAEYKERRESRRVLDLERKLSDCIEEKNTIEKRIVKQRNFEEEKERQIVKLEITIKEMNDIVADLQRVNNELNDKLKTSEEESFRLVETHKKRDSQKIGELEKKIIDLENNLKKHAEDQSSALDVSILKQAY